jgi:hypothetical protein
MHVESNSLAAVEAHTTLYAPYTDLIDHTTLYAPYTDLINRDVGEDVDVDEDEAPIDPVSPPARSSSSYVPLSLTPRTSTTYSSVHPSSVARSPCTPSPLKKMRTRVDWAQEEEAWITQWLERQSPHSFLDWNKCLTDLRQEPEIYRIFNVCISICSHPISSLLNTYFCRSAITLIRTK